ncbi:hypothetical protein FPV67DRAFT_1462574 [Lyophyllum atratum]|nr:hypothetical protein FPV67DRAFT_1462574 [Lyophyllum atratum]
MSYNEYEGPGKTTDGRAFMISVVFDGATYDDFSGNRIVIVCRESRLLNSIKIKDCLDLRRFKVKQNPGAYRATLSRNRALHEGAEQSSESRPKRSAGICTVVFELVENVQPSIIPDVLMQLVPLCEKPLDHNMRIVYDHTRIWTSTHRSAVLLLQSSHAFRSRWLSTVSVHRRIDPSGMLVHALRILPIYQSRPAYIHLPPTVLTRIARFAFGDRKVGWRRGLMSFGLVCKAWTPLLDLFFQKFYNPHFLNVDQADAAKVSRSLEMRPERGALMEKFSPYDYRLHFLSSADDWKTFWRSQNIILGLAPAIKDLHLSCTHQSLFRDLVTTLSLLKNVQNFRVTGPPSVCSTVEASVELRSLDAADIQSIISHWTQLRSLSLFNWNLLVDTSINPQSAEKSEAEKPQTAKLTCRINVLRLHNGILTGPQLLAFASPAHSIPSLHTVDMCNIQGLSNCDLSAFFSQIAASLESLSIQGCTISRGPGEEYALDTVISKMVRIHNLKSDGDIATAMVLSRKVRREKGRCQKKDTITIAYSPSMKLRSLVEALEVCYWDSVHVTWSGAIDDSLLEKALTVTDLRGINFTLAAFGRSVE